MPDQTGWISVAARWVGTLEDLSTIYEWDGTLHPSRAYAISAGFETYGSDDFNVARVKDGALVWFGWMDEAHPLDQYGDAAEQLGFRLATTASKSRSATRR